MREGGPFRRRAGAVLSLVVAALALPATAQAGEFPSQRVTQSRADVLDYWTPQRMAAARPASALVADVDPRTLPPVPGERGKPLSVAGTTGADELGGSPSRQAAEQVLDPSRSPYRTHGKVYFTLDNDYVCSATVIPSKIKRLVVTAGHCAYDASLGGFARNWIFVPGKNGSSEPYGRWSAKKLATTRQWARSTVDSDPSNDDVRYDVAFATMRKRSGRRLQRVVGARGIAFSQARNHEFAAFGYPAQFPFSGDEAYVCNSPSEGVDEEVSPPRPTRIDCDMTGGSSGGGWVIGSGRVNSVTSYGYVSVCVDVLGVPVCGPDPDGDKLYGPYFGQTIKALWRSQRKRR